MLYQLLTKAGLNGPYVLPVVAVKVAWKSLLCNAAVPKKPFLILYWWLAYYHFVRHHESLRTKLAQPIQRKGRQRLIQ